ncbi:glutamate N-acetyltransferase/amino-acid acetyltransferase [Candidatus Magnetobacterium bavaricum]|uniref:Arginine biosynthesis bifunctional protein ArgJ n=1 Tax=Candidatus Magnetobacterium bavaricum TaxID=29290 RepID=A0A0F3GVU8_9BACT|nr:glutamate N-acetyltransferase/amino-acid acetyltransferase [Candidatus Magnetobacterium bavaricum]
MFTRNVVKAAPVLLDMERIKGGTAQAVVINSGNANACTDRQGLDNAIEISGIVSDALHIARDTCLVASTGVIGVQLPMSRIKPALQEALANPVSRTLLDAASAIMTTDTFPKAVSRDIEIGPCTATVAAIAKGAGMIAPDMATLLCFVITDLAIDHTALQLALTEVVDKTFNKITIDGDMSTNDTVLALANGLAGNEQVVAQGYGFNSFRVVLQEILMELALMCVKDGEGATRFVTVKVVGATTDGDANRLARTVANSMLVKTAIYGADANWGRIMAAIGYSGVVFDPGVVDVYFDDVLVVKNGYGANNDSQASEVFNKKDDLVITIDINAGEGSAKIFTCDLTEDYVRINAHYRS